MKHLDDKVAAVTGAGSGIGRALALHLADRGCRLALSDVDAAGLAETERLLEGRARAVTTEVVDVADEAAVLAWAEAVVADHGRANLVFNAVRRRLKLPYWSLSAHLKRKVKNAVQYVCQFEEAVAREALERGLDGVVCGHIHCAEIRTIGEITYYNDGDWVESCTALVEEADCAMHIVDWAEETARAGAVAEARELAE